MGAAYASCEKELKTADLQLAEIEAQLKAISTTSKCAVDLASEKSKLETANSIKNTVVGGVNSCATSLPATQAKLTSLQKQLLSTQNSPCNTKLKLVNSQLDTAKKTESTEKTNYSTLSANAQAAQAAAISQINALKTQLKAEQTKYDTLKASIATSSSTCANSLIVAHEKIQSLQGQLSNVQQANLQKESSENAKCNAQLNAVEVGYNNNLNALKSSLRVATTNNTNYNTHYSSLLTDQATYNSSLTLNGNELMLQNSKNTSLSSSLGLATSKLSSLQSQLSTLKGQLSNLDVQNQSLTTELNKQQVTPVGLSNSYMNDKSNYGSKISNLQSLSAQINANNNKYSGANNNFGSSNNMNDPQNWGWGGDAWCGFPTNSGSGYITLNGADGYNNLLGSYGGNAGFNTPIRVDVNSGYNWVWLTDGYTAEQNAQYNFNCAPG
jgi:chromosome segregation ATPase